MENEFNILEKYNNGKKKKHNLLVAKCVVLLGLIGTLLLKNYCDITNEPIYYDKELDEFYTNSGKDIYRVTVRVPGKDYPCEVFESENTYDLMGNIPEKTFMIKLDNGSLAVFEEATSEFGLSDKDNYIIVEKSKAKDRVDREAFAVSYPEGFINFFGGFYDEEAGVVSFEDRYFITYSFDKKCHNEVFGNDCEVVDIEKVETRVYDECMSDYVVDKANTIETVKTVESKNLGKKMQ